MNKTNRENLLKLEADCKALLRDETKESMHIWRGSIRAIIAAVHELRKAGHLPPKDSR